MSDPMPLKPTTVRFASDCQILVQQAADEMGISMAQFVREAAIIRALITFEGREVAEVRAALRRLVESPQVQHLARREE